MEKKIQYLRLITGDEIIAEVVKIGSDTVHLVNSLDIEYVEMKTGANSPFFSRYDQYNKDHNLFIDRRHIIFMADPVPEMTEYYKTSLGYIEKSCDPLVIERVTEAERFMSMPEPDPIESSGPPPQNEEEDDDDDEESFNPNVFPIDNNHIH